MLLVNALSTTPVTVFVFPHAPVWSAALLVLQPTLLGAKVHPQHEEVWRKVRNGSNAGLMSRCQR